MTTSETPGHEPTLPSLAELLGEQGRLLGTCLDCGALLPIKGRGLCARDYSRAERSGTLDQWPSARTSDVPLEDVIRVHTDNPDSKQAPLAESLGMSSAAYRTALLKARRLGLIPQPRRYVRKPKLVGDEEHGDA